MHSFESLIAYLTFTKCSTVFFTQVNRIMKFMPASKTFNIKIAYSFYVAWKRLVVYFYWLPHSVNITTTVAAHIQAIFTFLLKTHMKIMLWSVNVDAWHWVLAMWNMEEIRDYGGLWSHEEQTTFDPGIADSLLASKNRDSWSLMFVCLHTLGWDTHNPHVALERSQVKA